MRDVISELSLTYTPEQLSGSVSATTPPDPVLINVSVVNSDPRLAQAIAESVGKKFTSTVGKLETSSQTNSPITVSVVKSASLPGNPFSPKKLVNLLVGIATGAMLALLIGLIRFTLDTGIKNASQLQGLELLASFPKIPKLQMGELFITDNNQFSYRAETFRQIRALILSRRKKIKIIKSKAKYVTIGICSANPAEGKTTTAINLAISFANMGLKAILIETDVRRPTLSENLLQISYINEQSRNLNGFASFVENGKYEIQTTINKNFFIIQSGTVREKSIENITAKKIELILKQLSRKFDVIIFDTSPLLSVSDTLPILPFCDEVIHVVKAKSSRTSEFKRALKLYKQHGANMTGVVLNMTPRHDLSGEYGYGYGYGYGYARTYGYSYANADDKTKVSSNWNFNKNRNLNKKKRSRKIEYQESEQVTLMLDRIKKDLKLNERN
jgi:receptor protein-tyrosine kinase